MKKVIESITKLLNMELHESVCTNANGEKCIPVSVVRCVAHEALVSLRDYEVSHSELLALSERAGEVLRELGRLKNPKG